jgi:hypothetical protein
MISSPTRTQQGNCDTEPVVQVKPEPVRIILLTFPPFATTYNHTLSIRAPRISTWYTFAMVFYLVFRSNQLDFLRFQPLHKFQLVVSVPSSFVMYTT